MTDIYLELSQHEEGFVA